MATWLGVAVSPCGACGRALTRGLSNAFGLSNVFGPWDWLLAQHQLSPYSLASAVSCVPDGKAEVPRGRHLIDPLTHA